MKRIHIECMTATVILAWVISNMLFINPEDVRDFFCYFLPNIIWRSNTVYGTNR